MCVQPTLYEEGVGLFETSKEMSADYSTMKLGDVKKIKLSAEEKRKKVETLKKLEKFRKMEAVREKTNEAKRFQQGKVHAAEGAAATVREMSEKLATSGKSMSFEARAKARRKLLAQKEIADALATQADEATQEFLEVKRRLNTSGADENEAWLAKITGEDNANRTAFESGTGVKVWLLGVPLQGPGLGTVYYGNYDVSDEPPEDGWLCYGAKAKKPAPTLKVVKGTIVMWLVDGAGEVTVNGSYTKSGKSDGIDKFCKSDGTQLFRETIPEQPDLGLTAEVLNAPKEVKEQVLEEDDDELPELDLDAIANKADPPSIQRLMDDPFDFEKLHMAGVKISGQEVRRKKEYQDARQAKATREHDKLFAQQRKRASVALSGVEGEELAAGLQKKNKKKKGGIDEAVAAQERLQKKQEEAALSTDMTPNMSRQADEKDVAAMLGGDPRIFRTLKEKVPPLDIDWVFLTRQPNGQWHPYRRQYYVDAEEKKHFEALRRSTDCKLELGVLRCISRRESHIQEINGASKRAAKLFAAHTKSVQREDVQELIQLMDQMRLATVETVEAIVSWRKYTEGQRNRGGDEDKRTREWTVTLTYRGAEFLKPSPAFECKQKRHCRGAEEAKRDTRKLYLGTYATKNEAAVAYDEGVAKFAVKLNTTVENMPRKTFHITKEGNFVSSAGSDPSVESIRKVVEANGGAKWTPSYMWNGENYLIKMLDDLDSTLQSCAPLVEYLGKAFPLEQNPLLLAMKGGLEGMEALLDTPIPPLPQGAQHGGQGSGQSSSAFGHSTTGFQRNSTPPTYDHNATTIRSSPCRRRRLPGRTARAHCRRWALAGLAGLAGHKGAAAC
jgi:hypothetical protein